MGKPIPTLGYPSRTIAVSALVAQGKSREEIGELLGMKPENVRSLLRHARVGAQRESHIEHRFSIGRDLRQALEPYARRRRMSVKKFVRYFLDIAVRDGLVDGILDDNDAVAGFAAAADAHTARS